MPVIPFQGIFVNSLINKVFCFEGNFINTNTNTNFLEYADFKKAVLDRIGPYNIKEARIKIQAHIPKTIAIFKKANKGCKDMYNISMSKKKQSKQFINGMKKVIDLVTRIGVKNFSSRLKLQRNLNITGYNFKYQTE